MLRWHLADKYFDFISSEMGTFHLGDEKKWFIKTSPQPTNSTIKNSAVPITQRGSPLTAEESSAIEKCPDIYTPRVWSDHQLQNSVNCGRIFMSQTEEWTNGGQNVSRGKKRQYKGHDIPFFVMEGAEDRYVRITTARNNTTQP